MSFREKLLESLRLETERAEAKRIRNEQERLVADAHHAMREAGERSAFDAYRYRRDAGETPRVLPPEDRTLTAWMSRPPSTTRIRGAVPRFDADRQGRALDIIAKRAREETEIDRYGFPSSLPVDLADTYGLHAGDLADRIARRHAINDDDNDIVATGERARRPSEPISVRKSALPKRNRAVGKITARKPAPFTVEARSAVPVNPVGVSLADTDPARPPRRR